MPRPRAWKSAWEIYELHLKEDIIVKRLTPVISLHIYAHPSQHLRRIRTNTGAEVHVDAKVDGVDVRLVICKSQEPSDSAWCGAAESLMKCTQHLLHEKVSG